jgi:polyhydroxybutyrate depolymerase
LNTHAFQKTLLLSFAFAAGCAAAPSPEDTSRIVSETDPVTPVTSGDAQLAPVEDGGAPAASTDAAMDAGTMDARFTAPGPAAVPVSARRSDGCGKGAAVSGSFVTRTRSIAERERTYHVRLPDGYDPNRAYPVVFRWHGRGGNGLSGGLGIEWAAGRDVIVAAADGLDTMWTAGSEEVDLALFDAMLDELSREACIDPARIFAYGFSAGGGFTNALGCKRASVIRAIAAIAGFDRADARCDSQPMAAWFLHDRDDLAVPIDLGRSARARNLRRNGCASEGEMHGDCTFYRGCRDGYPVVWCETGGLGHDIRGDSAPWEVWQFFSRLP